MADDGAMDDGTRVALRELAQRAEWSGTSRGGAEAEASRLRELGGALAARVAADLDDSTWAHRAVVDQAEYCRGASAGWSADDVAGLARLREAADIALAPGPGQAAPTPVAQPRTSKSAVPARFALPRGRRALAWGTAVVGCAIVAAIVIVGVGGGGSGNAGSGSSTAATQIPVSLGGETDAGTSGSASADVPSGGSTTPVSSAQVTAIQMSTTPSSDYPEVQIYGTITASGTGDVTVTVTIAGTSGTPGASGGASAAPQTSTEDESGQTSYALSQTLYLQRWCGQKSVTVTVSSGSVSSSAMVPVSGC
jgi:hypothetical protein